MKTDWKVKTLGEVCNIAGGSTPLRSNKAFWDHGDVPWFTIDDIRSQGRIITNTSQKVTRLALAKTSLRVLPPRSVLLCCTASVGEYAVTEIELTTNQQFNGLWAKDENKLYSLYLFHFCATLKDKLLKLSGKATIDFISASKVRTIVIPLPPLAEQQRIVAVLDEAFAAIDKAKENAQKNLQNARELFDSYLQSVFTNPGEDWEEKSLAEVCEISSKLIDPRNIEFIDMLHVGGANIGSVTGGLFDLKTAKEEGLISGKFLFNKSMVLYSKIRPYLMKVARPEFDGLCSADIYPLLPFQGKITRDYLFHLLLSPDFTQYAIKGSARAGMPKVNREHLFEYRFYIGSIEEQIRIVSKLDSLSAETKKLEAIYRQKLTDLDELKKAILQKAFQGELSKTQGVALCD